MQTCVWAVPPALGSGLLACKHHSAESIDLQIFAWPAMEQLGLSASLQIMVSRMMPVLKLLVAEELTPLRQPKRHRCWQVSHRLTHRLQIKWADGQ